MLYSCLKLTCPMKPYTLIQQRSHSTCKMLNIKASLNTLKAFMYQILLLLLILWLEPCVCRIVPILKPLLVEFLKGLRSVAVSSTTVSFWYLYTKKQYMHHEWPKRQMQSLLVDVNRIRNLATKNSFVAHEACRRSWKSLTLLCSEDDLREDGFTESFKLTPGLHKLQAGVAHLPLKIQNIRLRLQLLLRESSMKKMTPVHQLWLHCTTIQLQAHLHHQTPTSPLHQLLLQLGTSRSSMSSNLFGHY